MKDWQGRAGGVAGRPGTGSQAALGKGEDRVQPVGSTTGRRWPGGTPGEQDPAVRGHRGSHALHTHAAMLILTGACTHWHSAHTHTHTHLRTRTPTLSRALGSRQPLPSGEALWPRTAVVGTAREGAVEGRAGSDGALGAQSR